MDERERRSFAWAMLQDVLRVVRATGATPVVLSRTPLELDATVHVDRRRLSTAVNDLLDRDAGETAVLMADVPLVTSDTLESFFDCEDDVVLARGLGGGTNALISRHPDFTVDYHDGSYRDHLAIADEIGASVTEFDSYRLALDIDEPDDLAEVLLHGDARAAEWLRECGFGIESGDRAQHVPRTRSPTPQ